MMLKDKSKHTNHSCPASTRNAKTTPTFRLKAAWLSGKTKRIDIGNNSSVQYHLSINHNAEFELFKQDKDGLGSELSMVIVGSIRKHWSSPKVVVYVGEGYVSEGGKVIKYEGTGFQNGDMVTMITDPETGTI